MTEVSNVEAAAPRPPLSTRIFRAAGIALGLGVLFAWFGVYQTSVFPMPERIAYWTVLMGVGIAASSIANPLVINRWLPKAHALFQVAAISALISVPITIGLERSSSPLTGSSRRPPGGAFNTSMCSPCRP